jgi:hypothetical protein
MNKASKMVVIYESKGVHDCAYDIEGKHKCGRCAATGRFVTMIENGKPKGPGGACFRCNGKGYHDLTDRKRNNYYDSKILGSRL